jgi:hypothetical protein
MNYNHFTPTTPNMKTQFNTNYNVHANLQQSFAQSKPLIESQDFTNKANVLHNNLGEKLLAERVVEYRIQISSSDRDPKCFPNIFDFKTSFGNTNYTPNIKRNFKNIKYITLNSVMTPRTIAIDTSNISCDHFCIYPSSSNVKCPSACDPSTCLHNLDFHPYLILKAKELKTENSIGTSTLLDGDTFMLILDKKYGDMCYWKPRRCTVVYPNSLLSNLNQLSLVLMDANGRKLSIYDHCGKNIIGHSIKDCDDYSSYVDKYKCKNEFVEYTDTVTQVIYDFTFGVIENELNTLTNFS